MEQSPSVQQAAAAKEAAEAAATLKVGSKAEARRPRLGGFATWLASCCATCGKGSSADCVLVKCGKCELIRYCGRDCQLRAWKELGHKRSCGCPLPTQEAFASA